MLQKRPEVIRTIQDVPTHAGLFPGKFERSFFESFVNGPPQLADAACHCVADDRAVAEAVPVMKQLLRALFQSSADRFCLAAGVDQALKVAQQMCPAELLIVDPIVSAVAITGDDARVVLSQKFFRDACLSRTGDVKQRELFCDRRPQPRFLVSLFGRRFVHRDGIAARQGFSHLFVARPQRPRHLVLQFHRQGGAAGNVAQGFQKQGRAAFALPEVSQATEAADR